MVYFFTLNAMLKFSEIYIVIIAFSYLICDKHAELINWDKFYNITTEQKVISK